MALRLKFDRLRSLRPDVAVIQECADPGCRGQRVAPRLHQLRLDRVQPRQGAGHLHLRRPDADEKRRLCGDLRPLSAGDGVRPVSLQPAGPVGRRPAQVPAGATNDPVAALQYYRSFLAAGPSIVAGDFNRLPQRDVGAAQWSRQLGGRCAGGGRPDQRRLRHERRLGPAGAETDALPSAQVLARLRGRLHLHPDRRDRPPRRRSRWAIRTTGSPGAITCRWRRVRSDCRERVRCRFRARSH